MVLVGIVGAPAGAGFELEQNFLEVLGREFEAVLKNDESIRELLKKKALQGKSWNIVIRAGFYQNNNSLDAVLHIQHIFSNDETEWAYLIHAFNTKKAVAFDMYARRQERGFIDSENKSEHISSVIDFNLRLVNLLKALLRELSVLDWADGEGRGKKEVRIVLSNQKELVKVRRDEL